MNVYMYMHGSRLASTNTSSGVVDEITTTAINAGIPRATLVDLVYMRSNVHDFSNSMASETSSPTSADGRQRSITGARKDYGEEIFGHPLCSRLRDATPGHDYLGCELVNADELKHQLKILKSIGVDGVTVNCWWGIVERFARKQYNWRGYKELFQIVREQKLKLRVVMSFHTCGDNIDDDEYIPLPQWVEEIGARNPDIYFMDREGRRNHECLSWGLDSRCIRGGLSWGFDSQCALGGRWVAGVYSDFIYSFRMEFNDFFEDGVIFEIEVGYGPSGELRYPSYPSKYGWKYPGVGEFQCYDNYMMESLMATVKFHEDRPFWYEECSLPWHEKGSFRSCKTLFSSRGEFNDPDVLLYDSCDGRFFLDWYVLVMVVHADAVLLLAKSSLINTPIAAKVPCIHWWYKSNSFAAGLTAGYYHKIGRDGYNSISRILKKHEATLNTPYVDVQTFHQDDNSPEALADLNRLKWRHVQNVAWHSNIQLASENALPCYDREGYNRLVEIAKPFDDPSRRHLSSFTYQRLSPSFMEGRNLREFERFVRKMHGEFVF